jgi:2'-5' RNA ligase
MGEASGTDRIRAFVAIFPDEAVRSAIAAEIERLRAIAPSLHWTPPERLHLLLGFLGEQPPDVLWKLRGELDRAAASFPPFLLHVAGLRVWTSNDGGTVRGVAVACGAKGRPVHQLARSVREAASGLGLPAPDFHGSMIRLAGGTLAGDDARALLAQAEQANDRPYAKWPVDSFSLFESRIEGSPPDLKVEHKRLVTFPLRGAPPRAPLRRPSGGPRGTPQRGPRQFGPRGRPRPPR